MLGGARKERGLESSDFMKKVEKKKTVVVVGKKKLFSSFIFIQKFAMRKLDATDYLIDIHCRTI